MSYRRPMVDRFWLKIRKTDTCWEWTGLRQASGHGLIGMEGCRGRNMLTHRYSWTLVHGPIPPGMKICHHCDNPPCVNPAHLFMGTQADNLRDMRAKGRAGVFDRKGTANGHAKLTLRDVRKIRRMYATGAYSQQSIGDHFGIPQPHVSRIILNQAWREEV